MNEDGPGDVKNAKVTVLMRLRTNGTARTLAGIRNTYQPRLSPEEYSAACLYLV